MKLTIEFDLDIIGTDSAAFGKVQQHVDKVFEQIKRYPRQLAEPNLGYSCEPDVDVRKNIAARWQITDESM